MTTTTEQKIILDEQHRYWRGSIQVPGFSEILEAMGWPKNPYWTPEGREEGRAIHEWLLFLSQGKDTDSPPDPRIAGRVEGIRKFLSVHRFELAGGETPQYSPLGYCCTPDLWGNLDGLPTIIEAKRGAAMGRHKLQTAAQFMALDASGFTAVRRLGLYLKDGDFALEEHDDEQDFDAWRSIVSAYNARGIYE